MCRRNYFMAKMKKFITLTRFFLKFTAVSLVVAQFQSFIDSCASDMAAGKCDMVSQYELPLA